MNRLSGGKKRSPTRQQGPPWDAIPASLHGTTGCSLSQSQYMQQKLPQESGQVSHTRPHQHTRVPVVLHPSTTARSDEHLLHRSRRFPFHVRTKLLEKKRKKRKKTDTSGAEVPLLVVQFICITNLPLYFVHTTVIELLEPSRPARSKRAGGTVLVDKNMRTNLAAAAHPRLLFLRDDHIQYIVTRSAMQGSTSVPSYMQVLQSTATRTCGHPAARALQQPARYLGGLHSPWMFVTGPPSPPPTHSLGYPY